MAPEGKEVAVVPGAEGNPIEFKGLGQKAEPEGMCRSTYAVSKLLPGPWLRAAGASFPWVLQF
jgi:hypothetical protein